MKDNPNLKDENDLWKDMFKKFLILGVIPILFLIRGLLHVMNGIFLFVNMFIRNERRF
jgi:hypothetical protein